MQTINLSNEATKTRRITVIDALRGFALLGVILMHMLQRFGIFSGVRPDESLFPMLDEAIQWLSQNVIMGRFINIFACLFGLSFFIQMDSAAKKGIDFRKRFLWRMAILFVIGVIGNCFFTADILSIYAVFGIIMVFLFPLKNWILILIASLLLLGAPRALMTGYDRIVKTEQVSETSQPARRPAMSNTAKPSFINSAKENLTFKLQGKLNYQFGMYGRGYITLALFILGLVIGRLRFFEDVQTKQKRNIILFFGFALSSAVISLILNLIPQEPLNFRMLMTPGFDISFALLAVTALNDIQIVIFSGALALGFIVLYQIKSIGKYLNVLTPYGRMGLTNYEMQGILGAFIFSAWGFGAIFGTWGTTEVFALGLVVYAIQIIISHYWLKKFRYGPLEWLWRSGTYLKWQPLRKA
ncbi:DUF418 domain-containing protein [Dysgonomonas sp. ZJ279]|uniref:DUF418 domain-containing protein n=1 Tax=Dysgonomonas sp. ZJ279 TaxID=2709796 RepID=UPI0013EBE0D0|nr:DUF418 domain-containing protein [Dysgonomonas sp. ZJ279]